MEHKDLNIEVFNAFNRDWGLLTAGDINDFNCMTISWGSMGTLWGRPVVNVYVKPVRHTHSYMEKSDYFTVSFFPPEYRNDLLILGRYSGRKGNKLSLTGLNPIEVGKCVGYKEASLTVLCKKIYRQDLDINQIPEQIIEEDAYRVEAPHTLYVGQVIEIIK